jgi:3-deoxy-manno-octulosonate cytidylyltransferase (CMP-KDO synthetase)
MAFSIVIPARLESTRLPGKVLADIGGKPMLQHVYELAQSTSAEMVCIATDSKEVQTVAEGFGATVCMTSPDHPTGSERVAEAIEALQFEENDIVVNLQADEPLMPVSIIKAVASALEKNETIKVASACRRIDAPEQLFDPSIAKVVLNERGNACYFSRAPIPWDRDHFKVGQIPSHLNTPYFRHIGLYGYRAGFLNRFLSWDPAPAENVEKLEQLRILWNGGKIHMVVTEEEVFPGVDTPSDLERVRAIFATC